MSFRSATRVALFSVLFAFAAASTAGAAATLAFRNINEGQPAPDFTLKDTAGNDVSLSQNSGKVIVVVFFRPDQKNSQDALADLQKVYAKYGPKGLSVLAINSEPEQQADLARLIEQERLTFPVLVDQGRKVYGQWGAFLYPTTGIIDKSGVMFVHVPSHNRKYAEEVEGNVRVALGEITKEQLNEFLNPKELKLTPERKKAERHMMLGQKLVERKLMDKAAEELAQAVEADPTLPDARVAYGFVLLKLSDPAKARENFTKAMELDPKVENAKTGLGSACVAQGETDKGIEVLEDALKLNTHPARTRYELGKAYEKKGALDKAVENYRKALEEMNQSW